MLSSGCVPEDQEGTGWDCVLGSRGLGYQEPNCDVGVAIFAWMNIEEGVCESCARNQQPTIDC